MDALIDLPGAADDWPHEDVLRCCRILLGDHAGVAGMIRAARIARDAGTPVGSELERQLVLPIPRAAAGRRTQWPAGMWRQPAAAGEPCAAKIEPGVGEQR